MGTAPRYLKTPGPRPSRRSHAGRPVVATVRAPIVTVLYDRGGAYDRSSSRAGGFRISDGFISPLDLVEIGLVSADEASKLHALETAAPANAG